MSMFSKPESKEEDALKAQHDEQKALSDLHGKGVSRDAPSAEVLKEQASSARIGRDTLGRDRPIEASEAHREKPEAASGATARTAPTAPVYAPEGAEGRGQDLIEKAHRDGEEGAEAVKEASEEIAGRGNKGSKRR